MGQKKEVKLEDIADKLNVSIVSVSNALYGKKGVSPALRNRILTLADELGYIRNTAQKPENRNYHIGVLIAEQFMKDAGSLYMEIYKAVTEEVVRRGGITVLEAVNKDQENLLRNGGFFKGAHINGFLMIGSFAPEFIRYAQKEISAPAVCVGYYDSAENQDYIIPDDFHGMCEMVQHIIYEGHRKIGFAGDVRSSSFMTDRYMGYKRALQINGLAEEPAWQIFAGSVLQEKPGSPRTSDSELPQESLQQRTSDSELLQEPLQQRTSDSELLQEPLQQRTSDSELLQEPFHQVSDSGLPQGLPTAWVCSDDQTARKLIEKLKMQGCLIPEDITVTGFYGQDRGCDTDDGLTSFDCPKKELARVGIETLYDRIEKKKAPGGIKVLPGTLRKGKTDAAPRMKNE